MGLNAPRTNPCKRFCQMMRFRLACALDDAGWRFDLFRKGALPFAREAPVALSDWPQAAPSHPGTALLLALLDTQEAQPEGESLHLTHDRIAGLSRPEAVRLGLPPVVPLTLFPSHDAPIGEPSFALRVEWFQRGGAPVFGARRTGTGLTLAAGRFLILDPLYSALEAIDAVNAASGDASPAGLDRRMTAYARFKDHLIRLTGDLRADEYLRGLTIHQATGIGIDLAPGDETAPFLPTLYGDRPEDAATADPQDQDSRPEPDREADREPLLPQHHAKQFQKRFLDQGARSHFTLGNGVYTVLDAPVAAALQVLERVNRADHKTRQAFRQNPLAFLTPAIEETGGDCGVICDLRGYGERVIGVGDWVPPSLSFPLPVSRDWFPAEEVEVFTISIPDEVDLVIRAEEVTVLKGLMTQAQASGATVCDFNGRSLSLTDDLVKTIQGLSGRMDPGPRASAEEGSALPKPKGAAITKDNEELLTFLAEQRRQRGQFTPGLPRSLSTVPMPHQESGLGWPLCLYVRTALSGLMS